MQVGDIVRLKSGGPLMTIKEIIDKKATCVWFTREEKLIKELFCVDTLKNDKNDDSEPLFSDKD